MKKIKIGSILSILSLLVVGSVYGFWHQELEHTNHLKADTIQAEIAENFTPQEPEGTVDKEVSFQNKGSTDVFLRIAYVENWEKQGEAGETILLNNQLDGEDVSKKNWAANKEENWQDGEDGWFYYKHILKPGETTENVLESVSFPDYEQEKYQPYQEADYSLYFKVEMLQASTGDATLNKDEVNTDASATVFGKTPLVNYDNNQITWQ